MDDILLDRRLREAAPYIDDNGFTTRVLSQLPAARRQHLSLRAPILLGFTLLSCVLAYMLSDHGQFLTTALLRLATISPLWILAICGATGAIVATGGGVAALVKTRQARM